MVDKPTPLISVIVAVHDVATFVGAAIASLRAQTLGDFEALVFDDGSTDGSDQRVREAIADDPRFVLIRQDNAGLSTVRNRGLDRAKGQFVAFLDGDDVYEPRFLETLYAAIERDGTDWAACGIALTYPGNVLVTHSAIHGHTDLGLERCLSMTDARDVARVFPSAWNKLYRRSFVGALRFPEGVWFEDHEFFWALAIQGRPLSYIPLALVRHRRERLGQITGTDSDRVFDQFQVLDRLAVLIRGSGLLQAEAGLAQLASRLIHERALVLRQRDRRARYVRVARVWLTKNGCSFDASSDPEISRGLARVLEHPLPVRAPVSVIVIDAEGDVMPALDSLDVQSMADFELIVVVPPTTPLPSTLPCGVPIQRFDDGTPSASRLAYAASGEWVVLLRGSERLVPDGLLRLVNLVGGTDVPMGFAGIERDRRGYHDGWSDNRVVTDAADLPGALGVRIAMTPDRALALHPTLGNRILRRDLLARLEIPVACDAMSLQKLVLALALSAGEAHAGTLPVVRGPDLPGPVPETETLLRCLLEARVPGGERLPRGWRTMLYLRLERFRAESEGHGMRFWLDRWLRLRRAGLTCRPDARLDPETPLWLRVLFQPRSTLLSRLLHRAERLAIRAHSVKETSMYSFDARHHARFYCEADFASGAYLNLHFFDVERRLILFHVSLRRDEGLVVVNRRTERGWNRELRTAHAFESHAAPVELVFRRGGVSLRVNGRRIGWFDALPRPDSSGRFLVRRGFPGLRGIAHVAIEGPCLPDSVRVETGRPRPTLAPERGLYLTDTLEIGFAGITGRERAMLATSPAVLRIAGMDEEFRAVPRGTVPATGVDTALSVLLPGRIWDHAEDTGLSLTLAVPGHRVLATTTLTLDDMVARIASLAERGLFIHGDRLALTAIEHAHHADILSRLSAAQAEMLVQAAERFGLSEYLLARTGEVGALSGAAAILCDDPLEATVTEVRKQFAREIAVHADDPVALLDRLSREAGLPQAGKTRLILAMSEWFCRNDRALDLARYRRHIGGTPLPTPGSLSDAWSLSAYLPFWYAEGEFIAVADALTRLKTLNHGWVLTPAIGWVAERAAFFDGGLDGLPIPPAKRRRVVDGVLAWIESKGADYWERSECICVIRGFVALLFEGKTIPADQSERAAWLATSTYALSPAFWSRVSQRQDDRGRELPEIVQRAGRDFAALQALVESGDVGVPEVAARIEFLLDLFRQFGTHGMQRFRRDILGPAGIAMAPGASPDLLRSLVSGLDPYDALLRHIAFPRHEAQAAPLPDGTARWLEDAIAKAWTGVPRGGFGPLQSEVARDAMRLLADQPVDRERLNRSLTALSVPEAGFLGIAIAVSLARGLNASGREAEADAMIEHAVTLVRSELTDEGRDELAHATAPALALAALQAAFPDDPLCRKAEAGLAPRCLPLHALPRGGPDRVRDLSEAANPVFDTLVCLYTCRANLDTRVAALRVGWLRDLGALGVPVLIFVGDGDGQREGDIVCLDAPDDYESLPLKTIAMTRWVLENTRFSYLFKIDDDCFLNASAFFESLTHLKSDYHGRRLHRVRGQMDRTWHMAKSHSARGRLELDKSPEPSTYADGGSGYTLSRRAMAALVDAADSAEGQTLIKLSFMEDKLVGDLLAMRGIRLNHEDYRVSVLRRTRPGGPLVAQWENGFLPFAGSGIKVAHLDGHEKQAEVHAAVGERRPKPYKIWPSFQPARLGARSNALDLISSVETLNRVNAAEVAVVACLRNEMSMLPRFLDHYRALGVQGFLVSDNGSDDGSFEYLADQPDVALFSVDTDYNQSHYGVAWQQAMLANLRFGRWSLVADADEFLFWNTDLTGSLPDLAHAIDDEGADAARVFMLDMYPGGPLENADFRGAGPFEQAPFVERIPLLQDSLARGPFSSAPIWTSALRHRLIPGSRPELFVAQKYALLKYRPWMRLSAGLHFVANIRLARRELFFGHFKYNAAFHAKAQAEVARKQHFNGAEEYRKYLALVSEGRDVLFDPAVSVRWDTCPTVLSVLTRDGSQQPR